MLSPEILPSLRSLTMCEVSAQRATRLHTALLSILPQLHTLTVLDWHDWPEDALIHCTSLTTLRARLLCRITPSPLTHDWPHCLPATLEALTLITMCKRACHRAACNAVDRTQQLVDMLAREDALLPALQEVVVAGPVGTVTRAAQTTAAGLAAGRGVLVEWRADQGIE